MGELITASEWQRAALVWAFTEDQQGKRTTSVTSDRSSMVEFAKLGVSGLRSVNSIKKYRRAWSQAIADGFATDVKPGDLIDLPDVEWPRVTIR
ncbi:Uncharacterised protein [Mycobacteroides abscessus subsp. abscessus]|nr:Uncharacterised protein [Mycobacteroides abscessus subsp. abscessus]